MKHMQRIFFLLTIAFTTTTIQAQVSSADTIVHRLFTSLKNKDEKTFLALYPNGQQMTNMMRGMMEAMFKSEEMQKMMAMDEKSKNMNIDSLINAQLAQVAKPEAQAQMQKNFAKTFNDILAKGESKGVNWNQAQLISYTLDSTSKMDDDEDMKMFSGAGIKSLNGVIDFRSGGTDYQMNFEKVLHIPSEGGWFGGEFKQVIKKGENFGNEVPPTDESAEEKTKVKAENGGTKTKTKTSAGKTKTKTKTKS